MKSDTKVKKENDMEIKEERKEEGPEKEILNWEVIETKERKEDITTSEVNFVLENHYQTRLPTMRKMAHCLVNKYCRLCETAECRFISKAVLHFIFHS